MVQVQWSRGVGSQRMKIARLRSACVQHRFEMVKLPAKGTFKLIDLSIGHAVMNQRRRTPAFNVSEALAFFRTRERDAGDDQN